MELDKGGVEDDQEMLLMYQYYPAPEIYHAQQLPDQQAALVREGKQRRRRRKKGGSGSGSGSSEGSGVSKRKLSEEQVKMLELQFGNEHKLVLERKETIAAELGLDPRQVAVWFQNRRARWKSKKLEEEYIKLKTEHETTVLEICRLQTEVLRLTQQLSEQEKKKQRLLEKCEGHSSNSSNTSSFSIEAMQPPSFGEFGMGGLESIFYLPENNYLY